MTLQLAPPAGILKGFSNAGVLTVAALFPVAAGMYSTGAISLLSQRLISQPKTETSANLKILPPIVVGSAFINNTPMVAMMIPVVRDLRRQTGLVASSLLMGISFGLDSRWNHHTDRWRGQPDRRGHDGRCNCRRQTSRDEADWDV